jgi:hypothetical protein
MSKGEGPMNSEPLPQQGGSYTRDPKTGDLKPVQPVTEQTESEAKK